MKFTPIPSTSPRALAHDGVRVSDRGSVHLEAIDDPRDGHKYLSVGIGGDTNVRRLWLTREQTNELIGKLVSMTPIVWSN